MRRMFLVLILFITADGVWAQSKRVSIPDSSFSTYYLQKTSHFRSLPLTSGDIVFLGNSITDGAEWSELFSDPRIKNRGISGDVSAGVIQRINEVTQRRPAKIFLMIGINDLAQNIPPDSVAKNILWIADFIQQESPSTKVFIQSILPVNDTFRKFSGHAAKSDLIKRVNGLLERSASVHHYTYLNLHASFCNRSGKLDPKYTNDGLHLTGEGYRLWKHLIYYQVLDLQEKPSIIPQPQEVKWNGGLFPLYLCETIVVRDSLLGKPAALLKEKFRERGKLLAIENSFSGPHIELRIDPPGTTQSASEAYRLIVTNQKITISANAAHGAFNAIQTLLQLARDTDWIDTCEITDWPAYEWRGYMVDAGRNFQSVDLLKQQIEVMAAYKLNVFHLHLTEDLAWRLASKQYTQLIAPENMLRHRGQYYSEQELKELIAFCSERFIVLVPEIDMPGHSAAFTRAMKTDMQSADGMVIIKNILTELCDTYQFPYVHIGADEVKISNKHFIPEITALLESRGKKVIGWEPGGNFSAGTVRQLWMDDNGKTKDPSIQFIDSRHLYLNHMDPLESVVTIFNRRIGGNVKGDKNLLGGTICLWHDRAVANQDDVLKMNPVYPAMLAFGERSWRGGGRQGWVAGIGKPGSEEGKSFAEFENRLLDHKKINFRDKPFLYQRQSSQVWRFYGPYSHQQSDSSSKFEPEMKSFDAENNTPAFEAIGGTHVLRHWWHPLIKGLVDEPEEFTTWYAWTKIWSDENKVGNFWIGFNNLSRSPATDSPPAGAWDNKGSAIWINGISIEPPLWQRGGQKGNPEIPLIDEGYEYRQPSPVYLKKGWNVVLVKLPVNHFKGKDWHNPVKWMFTLVQVGD